MIEPFFFGPRNAFGLFQSAVNGDNGKLVVICPPFFDEYRRCYKAIVEFGYACAAKGYSVLRIDYSGTGEAGGDLPDFTAADWVEDIHLAIEEGKFLSNANEVYLLGVRFGATLASQCTSSAVKRYIFWDPIRTGQAFIEHIDRGDNYYERLHLKMLHKCRKKMRFKNYRCFHISPDLRTSMAALSMDALLSSRTDAVSIVTTERDLCEAYPHTDCVYSEYPYDWRIKHIGLLVPKPVLVNLMDKVAQ